MAPGERAHRLSCWAWRSNSSLVGSCALRARAAEIDILNSWPSTIMMTLLSSLISQLRAISALRRVSSMIMARTIKRRLTRTEMRPGPETLRNPSLLNSAFLRARSVASAVECGLLRRDFGFRLALRFLLRV